MEFFKINSTVCKHIYIYINSLPLRINVVFFFFFFFFFSSRISVLNLDCVSHCCHSGMLLEKYIGNSDVYVGFTDVRGETMLICVVQLMYT